MGAGGSSRRPGASVGVVLLPSGSVVHDIGKERIVGVVRDADDVEHVVGYPFRVEG